MDVDQQGITREDETGANEDKKDRAVADPAKRGDHQPARTDERIQKQPVATSNTGEVDAPGPQVTGLDEVHN